jgi:hypothetical protein
MLFNFLNNVFLLDLPLEAPQRVLQRLSVLKSNFSQSINTPISMRRIKAKPVEQVTQIVTYGIAYVKGNLA